MVSFNTKELTLRCLEALKKSRDVSLEIIVIDNVRHALESASLSSALTSDYCTDRVVGTSERPRVQNRATWIVTGNNLQFSNEISRRMLRSGLFQDEEDGFGEGNWASRLPLAERPRKVLRYDLGVAPHS